MSTDVLRFYTFAYGEPSNSNSLCVCIYRKDDKTLEWSERRDVVEEEDINLVRYACLRSWTEEEENKSSV